MSQEISTYRSDCETDDAWVPHGDAKPATHVTEPPEHNGIWGGRAAVGSQGPLYAQVPGSIPCGRLFVTLALFCKYFVQIFRGLVRMFLLFIMSCNMLLGCLCMYVGV